MHYERIIDKEELNKLLTQINSEINRDNLSFAKFLQNFKETNLKQGENALIRRFDFYCKKYMVDLYYNNDDSGSSQIDYLRSMLIGCLSISAPPFYKSYRQVNQTLSNFKKIEKDIINKCIVHENTDQDIIKCVRDKHNNLKQLISYDISIYNKELEQFSKDIYY
jgi:hypothetical protein